MNADSQLVFEYKNACHSSGNVLKTFTQNPCPKREPGNRDRRTQNAERRMHNGAIFLTASNPYTLYPFPGKSFPKNSWLGEAAACLRLPVSIECSCKPRVQAQDTSNFSVVNSWELCMLQGLSLRCGRHTQTHTPRYLDTAIHRCRYKSLGFMTPATYVAAQNI